MHRLYAAFLGVMMLTLSGFVSPGISQSEMTQREMMKKWLEIFHEYSTGYVMFPNGKLYKKGATSELVGPYIGTLILWHCGWPVFLSYERDASIYLPAKPIRFLDDGDQSGRYKTQCALNEYPADPWR